MPARAVALAALLLAIVGCRSASAGPETRPALGLMTTLPLLWGEHESFGAMLASDAPPGWVRAALEQRFAIAPIDSLDEVALGRLRLLLLAQPRVLSPRENVALDAWVRAGGRVLILADPLLTAHSRFPLGDRRRPQDVALLSPLLAHWGLVLTFDDGQPEGERAVTVAGGRIPVEQAGALAMTAAGQCTLSGRGLLARCRIGKGIATIFADAAVLDEDEGLDPGPRKRALEALLHTALD